MIVWKVLKSKISDPGSAVSQLAPGALRSFCVSRCARPNAVHEESQCMSFNAKDFAELLHPEQLELLAELAEDLDDEPEFERRKPSGGVGAMTNSLKSTRSKRSARKKSQSKLSQVIQASGKALKKRQAEADESKSYFQEWNDELDDEVLVSKKSLKRLPAVITRSEVRELLAASEKKLRDHLVIRTLYATGCRRSELEEIKVADLNLEECKVFIRSGKGDKDRHVLIDPKTAELLGEFVYGRALEDPIFDIEDKQINRVVRKWGKKVGINQRYEAMGRHFSAHALRHAFASQLLKNGADLRHVQEMLGHSSVKTTEIYTRISAFELAREFRDTHPRAGRERDQI